MAKTSAEKLAKIKEYQSKKDAIMLRPDKAEGEKIRDAAKATNNTVSQYILDAVREYMHPSTDTGSAQGLSNDQIRRLKILYNGLVDQENAAYKQATYAKATPAEHARNTSAYNTALSRLGIVQAVFEIIGLDYEMGRRFKIDD